MTVRIINTLDQHYRWRLARFTWDNTRHSFSAFFSVALCPTLFAWQRGFHDYSLTLYGVRLHYRRSYGGRFPVSPDCRG